MLEQIVGFVGNLIVTFSSKVFGGWAAARPRIIGEIEWVKGTSQRNRTGNELSKAFDSDLLLRVCIQTKRAPTAIKQWQLTIEDESKKHTARQVPVGQRFAGRYIAENMVRLDEATVEGRIETDTRICGLLRFEVPELGRSILDRTVRLRLVAIDSTNKRHQLKQFEGTIESPKILGPTLILNNARLVNEFKNEETRRLTLEEKLDEIDLLYEFGQSLGWGREREKSEAVARECWRKLKELYKCPTPDSRH